MSNIAIIPARGGSKRIPRKNIKLFFGKPIIAYSIEAALKSNLFDEVIVSTDDKEIAKVAIKYGATVPFFRSEKNSDDFATTFDVLNEVISKYEEIGKNFDYTCCLYPCAVFANSSKLNKAFKLMQKKGYKSIFPIIEYSFPIQRSLKLVNGNVNFQDPEMLNVRSQDLESRYHDAGQFYIMKTEVILNNDDIIGNKAGSIIISELEAQDVDTMTDWQLAELKYQLLNK